MQLDMDNSAAPAALAARAAFTGLARGGGLDEPRMAKIAQAAIFEEALMNALHARLSELRTVAK